MEYIVATESAAEFITKVERMFTAGKRPTCYDVRALVPNRSKNVAVPGSFGTGGIYKYYFETSDGIEVCVKYHRRHMAASGGLNSNSYRFCTAQFQIGGAFLKIHPMSGTSLQKKPGNWTHLPIQPF
jgi:hypothetical protein